MGNEDLIKQSDVDQIEEIRLKAQNFQKILHKNPSPNEVQKNKYANNSEYLPISYLEMNLDELFFGLWQTEGFTTKVIANEMVGELTLKYFHPTYHVWLSRIGAGAVQIQMISEEKGGSGDITNIKDKIINTLTKDYPHLKAECFRNACLSIGKAFGRDLNRRFEDQYQPILKEPIDTSIQDAINKIMIALDDYIGKDKEEIKNQCSKAVKDKKFDLKFANEIAQKIGAKI